MSAKGSNQSLVKVTNQRLILKAIYKNKRMSRSDLAKALKISNPSVSKHVDELLEKNILIEAETIATDVGRHPIMLEFNASFGCVAAIDLFAPDARICITDVMGKKLEYARVALDDPISTQSFDHIVAVMREMLAAIGDRCGALLSICIGVRGIVDPRTGMILSTSHIENYKDINLCDLFGNAFGVPVSIKNTANLSVFGEYINPEYKYNEKYDSIGYVALDSDVGLGAIIDRKLYEGRRGFACDAAAVISTARLLSAPANLDDFDVEEIRLVKFANTDLITAAFRKSLEEGRESIVRDWISSPADLTFDDVARAYGMNDFLAVSHIKRFALLVAGLCHNLSSFFDFEAILLGGAMIKLGDPFLAEVRNVFYKLTTEYHKTVEINLSINCETSTLLGGITVAQVDAMNSIVCPDGNYITQSAL